MSNGPTLVANQLIPAIDVLFRNSPQLAAIERVELRDEDYAPDENDPRPRGEHLLSYASSIVQTGMTEFVMSAGSLIEVPLAFDSFPVHNGRIQDTYFSVVTQWYKQQESGPALLIGQTIFTFEVYRKELLYVEGSHVSDEQYIKLIDCFGTTLKR